MTAETALALPVLVVVLAAALWALACVAAQLRCVDAASLAARAAARGDAAALVTEVARRAAPDGATVEVRRVGEQVVVVVRADVRPFGTAARRLPALPVQSRAVAAVEPGLPR